MFYTLKKIDLVRIVFGALAVLLFVYGMIKGINNILSLVSTFDLLSDEISDVFGLLMPPILEIPAIFIGLAALVMFGIFLFLFSDTSKKSFSIAFSLSALAAFLFSVSFSLSYFYADRLYEFPRRSFFIYLELSIVYLVSAALLTILAVKLNKAGKGIRAVAVLAVICGFLPGIIYFIYYAQANRVDDLDLFRVLFIQTFELIILPLFFLVCPQVFESKDNKK